MAQRGKRVNRNDNDLASCPGAIKRRKCRLGPAATGSSALPAATGPSEEEETMASSSQGGASWTPRPVSDIKISSIYNRSAAEAPAELFRKDLISAMKLPDSEPLSPNEYWVITDQWKQEWERGVQVPVNPDSLPEPMVTVTQTSPLKLHGEFKLPKKFIRISRDDYFNPEDHHLSTTPARAEKACAYDLDDTDIAWLDVLNGERAQAGQLPITESELERVIEELELRCWERIQTIVKNEEGLGIEYDENVICDVCRSPDSEEGNEMVFCDCCNICVHQACYGITSIPDGSWLCRTCSLSQRPDCVLCPNKGGAMKCTRSGQKWAHVSCALWIPEVSIGCVERMEPITKISSIPQSRWALICVLCRERVGACIQCSIKTCKTAYHVTCAFKYGLEMKAIIEDEMADDGVKLRSYCQKHSRTNTKDKVGVGGNIGNNSGNGGSDSEDGESRRRKRKDMTSEEKNQARAAKLQEIEAEFDKHVCLKDIVSQQLDVDTDAIIYIYNYWKLKRRAGHNKPLLAPRCGELSSAGARAQGQAADLEKMRTFVQLRQDLERVRNLCYMVGRREKLCRSFLRLREQTFHKQSLILSGPPLPPAVAASVLAANHGPSIYDRLYSHPDSEEYTRDIDTLVARIAGIRSPTPVSSNEKKVQPDFNGASNKKMYFNGSVRKKSLYGSDLSSMSSSEPDVIKSTVKASNKCSNKSKNFKLESDSSTEDEVNSPKSKTARRKAKKSGVQDRTRSLLQESSESDKLDTVNNRSRTLQHMEKELGSASGSESDELLPLNTNSATRLGPSVASAIYSDTDSDSQEHASHSAVLITKAAVKEFSAADISKNSQKSFTCKDTKQDYVDDSTKNKENVKSAKKKEYIPSALIVPQRQAAKKASEIMQRSQAKRDNLTTESIEFVKSPGEETKSTKQTKEKPSGKKQKDNKTTKDQTKSNDVYDFDKEFGDGMEILAYVPQRQAAKKAAEHIKSGMGTKIAQSDAEMLDVKLKKDSPESGKKKENKKEESPKKEETIRKETKEEVSKKPKKLPECKYLSSVLSSNSESSSSSSCSSSSESSSDTDESKSPTQQIRSSVKDQASSSNTSSESDTANQSKNKAVVKRQFVKSVDEPIQSEKKKVIGRKLKKLPDKKLKTSDGRHGPEFQPPSTEREESSGTSISKEQLQQHQQQQQQQPDESQQQTINKKADQRESSKKSGILQPQPPTDQNLFSGSRNNDGSRNLSGSKSVKKSNQIIKQSEQPPIKNKEDNSTGSRTKSDTRKRKSTEIPSKDDKNVKEASSLRKGEKRLTEKPTKEIEKDINKDISKTVTLDSIKCVESTLKADDKKIKKPSNKNAVNTLEEEMKQRRAERDSPKKSLKGLDKLLEKREHMDKLSKTKNTEIKIEKTICNEQSNTKGSVQEKLPLNDTIKSEDHKNHISEDKIIVDKPKSEEISIKNDITEISHEKFADRKSKSEDKIESMPTTDSCETRLAIEETSTKEGRDDVFSKPTLDKIAVSENVEKEVSKRKKSSNRSIFSPQHGSKDPSVSELFDFDQDILTDDMVNDDGFNIPRDAEERSAPLTFSFNNELWFKEDSKEDSARETLHLVEKLRMELSKKSNSSQFELEPVTVEDDIKKEETQVEKAVDQIPEENEVKILETETVPAQEMKDTEELARTSDDIACKNHVTEEKRKLCYTNNSDHYVSYNNEDLETSKVTVVERAKLDRAEADERWVPPSIENFNPADVHLNTLMDNQNHRYGNHQFTNDIANVLPESNSDTLVHSQLNMNMQEQYLLQQTHSMVRAAQHLEPHAENRAQSMAVMEQQVTGISTQIVDEITPMEMVNRHLIGLPNSEDDQGSEMDRVLEKEEMSSDMRQDYVQNGSPYNEMNASRQDTRWAESQVLPSRRSTSSSITSASSGEDHTAIPPYKNIPPMPFPACSAMDAAAYHAYSEANSYAGPVSLFPPQPCSAPLPYPSPGTAMFPPPFGAPFPTPQSLLSHVPKPLEESLNMQASPCTAAFTSSSHNMALTAAMVSPTKVPTPPPQSAQPSLETEHEPPQLQQDANVSVMPPMMPSFLDSTTTTVTAAAVVTTATTITTTSTPMSTAMSTTMSPAPLATVTTASTTLTPTVQVSEAAAAAVAAVTAAVAAVENAQEVQVDNKTVTVPQQSGKKSPSKPTRTSARVTSLQGKSPGKSPRHGETIKSTSVSSSGPRGRGRGAKAGQQQQSGYRNRGRGRGRGRGRNNQASNIGILSTFPSNAIHNDDSIQNKLVGTVYDFDSDEDSTNETNIADLRTMRERKKSTDIGGEKRGEGSLLMTNDGIHQSRLSSPSTLHKKYADDKRLSSPAMHDANVASGVVAGAGGSGAVSVSAVIGNVTAAAAIAESESNAGQVFADTVLPLLPGPVDMRTYNSNVDAPSSSLSHSQSYTNHLLSSFAAGVSTDSALPDIEEDIEKELQSALIAGSKQQADPSSKANFNNPSIDAVMASSSNFNEANKVSLSDSRNQLKVKIKGPFLDANYVPASSVPPLAQQAPVIITPAATSASVASGTSNLRRMRKKELLRQYCSQDMNMDGDPACGNATSAPITLPPVNRTVITIPKAVASMTSIPTREDYKAVVDANMEKKRRKERGSFFDVTDEEGISDRRRSGGSGGGMIFGGNVDRGRRGRQAKPSVTTMSTSSSTASGAAAAAAAVVAAAATATTGATATGVIAPTAATVAVSATATAATATTVPNNTNNTGPPKLKIKIGNSIIGQEMGNVQQDDRTRIRPPKKRLSSIPSTPSIEELRRESMKFRRMIMAGFDNDDEKTKVKSKKDKNGKRKRRQSSKKEARVQILEGGAATPKLIIRLGKSSSNSSTNELREPSNDVSSFLTAGIDVAEQARMESKNADYDARIGPPPVEPSKEELAYPMDSVIDDKKPTDSNTSATALRNVRSAKVTPIRLKLTRCQEGYELKDPVASSSSSASDDSALVNSLSLPSSEELPCSDTRSGKLSDKKSSKEDDIPLLSQSATHNSSGCPPAPLPQGCQVR
ncbi:PHD finger protein rhinoceros [Vespa velutina]|uniref:PHD finger protein rhinoceros n=1 Tax=Vespa velutina TaxID=202808 RepID=UPI001FB41272|nr:PHD finger protein rhinoceros [Vespa velutina]XP_047345700.1 PHD finger protein rhinoceros [Vespa velutina]XP_047345701.1 PHD finger protein rhinoceros [Vespa velutina]XP_047345702.1 PHD finger protein rhinoceros [Vespa velutina]XP_047345703.1 PHD finger protein rhinoceros [Vespa velutina]XP_047345704.1 PHD finger protein rhinoceros [Vespa velutina]XP_047345705.1 PHD finger protein rhinoceros [Vespa velutina]XP_047345706.1 PHD finger protein rhinoceros [Vespa velutina]XP_047345707.1 PHD 